jgi:hypothetical protein
MEAVFKSGKKISGRLAEVFTKRGITTAVSEPEEQKQEAPDQKAKPKPAKKPVKKGKKPVKK